MRRLLSSLLLPLLVGSARRTRCLSSPVLSRARGDCVAQLCTGRGYNHTAAPCLRAASPPRAGVDGDRFPAGRFSRYPIIVSQFTLIMSLPRRFPAAYRLFFKVRTRVAQSASQRSKQSHRMSRISSSVFLIAKLYLW